jgi:chromosome segregation ATPase
VDPLVEAARKAREEHKTATKPATVFTNDNIPTTPNAINVVGTASAASDENQQKAANASSAGGTGAQNDEASWRKRFADARAELQRDQDNLSVMKRELSVLQVQYYPDPSKTLMQSVTNSDIAKKHQNIDTMEKQVQADQQAISNLEDELRKAGGDPAWARE